MSSCVLEFFAVAPGRVLVIDGALGEAVVAALQASPAFDITANIAGLIEAGAFAALTFGDA